MHDVTRSNRTHVLVMLVALTATACAEPVRRALPAPLTLTMGAVPVPANGVGRSFEFNDGFRGQELGRTEMIAGGLLAGRSDAFSLGIYAYGETREDGVGGTLLRLKVPLGRLAPRNIVALHAATASTSRRSGDEQDEALTTVDVAVPVAFRVDSWQGDRKFIAVYLGPRLVYEHYADNRLPSETMNAVLPGALFGVHLGLAALHLFAEATLAYVPENRYQGRLYGGRMALMPALGAALQLGRSFRWGGS